MATKTATASLEERLKANPDSLSFSRMAEYFRSSGDIARAIDICVSGNSKHPEYVTGRIVLGRCYEDLDNHEEAVKAFTSVCLLDRRNMVAMKMLADIFLRSGSREKAGDLYALLADMDPWNETLSRSAARTPGSRDADVLAILGLSESGASQDPYATVMDAPKDAPQGGKDDAQNDAQNDALDDTLLNDKSQGVLQEAISEAIPGGSMEKGPGVEADAAAQKAVTQEVARADLGITEVIPGEKDEAVLETAENFPKSAEETFAEATTVTGTDIADRMAMLFEEKPATEAKEAAKADEGKEEPLKSDREPSASVTEDAAETIEVQPVEAIPDGNTIASRIDELFSRDTLKMPALQEAAPEDGPASEKPDSSGRDGIDDTILVQRGPASADEAEFEETMIMDAAEVKDFLHEDIAAPESLQKLESAGDESGAAKEAPLDLISEPIQDSAETALPAELIIDEKDNVGGGDLLKEGPAAAVAVTDNTVTGDDVVRLMTGFFEGEEDKAISEVVGPETIDDFFEGAGLAAEPLQEGGGPAEIEPTAAPVDEKASLVREADQGEKTDIPAEDDTISGDDVARRIDKYFSKRETGPGDALKDAPTEVPLAADFQGSAIEGPAAVDVPMFPAAGAPSSSLAEESAGEATIFESVPEDSRQPLEIKKPEEPEDATVIANDMVSGDDVVGRIDGMFSDSEEVRRAAMAGSLQKDGEADKGPGIEDTRVVDEGRPSETEVIEDTVAESAGGIISGADIEERLDEYFHEAAGRTPGKNVPDEEATYPDLLPGTMVDKKADYEETIIADDGASIGAYSSASSSASVGASNSLSIDQIAGEETISAVPRSAPPVADEEAIVETVDSLEETLEVEDTGDREETLASKKTDDSDATAVFTDFAAGSVSDAPPVPPEVPLFTLEKPRSSGEETKFIEFPAAPAPAEPDIPDHVLTPTLADIYLQQGQSKLALTIYRRLQEKNPANEKLGARVMEIEKALAEGTLPAAPVEQKTAAVKVTKKAPAKRGAHARQSAGEDTRPLAGVRLKKRPKLNWRKK